MAKTNSKKDSKASASKAGASKTAPAKAIKGVAAKLKNAVAKVVGKPTPKPAAKAPLKAAKPVAKEAAKAVKPAAKAPIKKAAAQPAKPVKADAKHAVVEKKADKASEKDKKALSKSIGAAKDVKVESKIENRIVDAKKDLKKDPKKDLKKDLKKESAAKSKKAKKGKPEEDLEDDLVGESEDFGPDELSEYEEELEIATEELEVDETEWTDAQLAAAAPAPIFEDFITDAEGNRICRVRDCDQIARVDAHCRYHYLLLWKKIQIRKKILVDGKLEKYVEELTARYPDKFLEVIRRDLRSEKDFMAAIAELEIDESAQDSDFEDESQSFIDEVRGTAPESMSDDDEF